MKLLQNKSTGVIGCLECSIDEESGKMRVVEYIDFKCWGRVWYYSSLAELNEEWEDYEESEEYWIVTDCGGVSRANANSYIFKQIGNHFKTKEDAEKAVEKLKAWKRLKDKGFKFKDWNCALRELYFTAPDTFYDRLDMVWDAISDETTKDLDLLFYGEDD